MKKLNYHSIANYALITILVLTIFLFFTPVLTFKIGRVENPIIYGFSGISLLINNVKAQLIEGKDLVATLENLFPRSNIMVATFSISLIVIILDLISLGTKKQYKTDLVINPIICALSITNLALICNLKSTYKVENFTFETGYGATMLIVFFILAILVSLFLSIYPIIIRKIRKD